MLSCVRACRLPLPQHQSIIINIISFRGHFAQDKCFPADEDEGVYKNRLPHFHVEVMSDIHGPDVDISVIHRCERFVITISPLDTVTTVKAKIEAERGIAPYRQHLILDGQPMEEDRLMFEYNIRRSSILNLEIVNANERGPPKKKRRIEKSGHSKPV